MTQTATYYASAELCADGDVVRGDGVSFRCLVEDKLQRIDGTDGQTIGSDAVIYTNVEVPKGAQISLPGETERRRILSRRVAKAPDGGGILEIAV